MNQYYIIEPPLHIITRVIYIVKLSFRFGFMFYKDNIPIWEDVQRYVFEDQVVVIKSITFKSLHGRILLFGQICVSLLQSFRFSYQYFNFGSLSCDISGQIHVSGNIMQACRTFYLQ